MTRHRWAFGRWIGLVAIVLLLVQPALQARETARATGVVGVDTAQLDPGYWIRLQPGSDAVILERDTIAAQNRRLLREDGSTRDIATLPDALPAVQVRAWIENLSSRPTRTLYDEAGTEIPTAGVEAWMEALDMANRGIR